MQDPAIASRLRRQTPARHCRRQGRAVHGRHVREDCGRSDSRRHRHRHAPADCAAARSSSGFRRAIRCPMSAAWPQDAARSRLRSGPIPSDTLVVLLSGGASALDGGAGRRPDARGQADRRQRAAEGGRRYHRAQHHPQTSVGRQRRAPRSGRAGPDRLSRDLRRRRRRSQRHRVGAHGSRSVDVSRRVELHRALRRRSAPHARPRGLPARRAGGQRSRRRRRPAIRASSDRSRASSAAASTR